ncbi:hypothetical protein EIP86_003849 [Pleurotus ostreatoroseus]|nr:hypothetical protein EIP86_003849 [Pleurotus ostreatoroseus]
MYSTVETPHGLDATALVSAIKTPTWPYQQATELNFNSTQHLSPGVLRKLSPALPAVEIVSLYKIDWSGALTSNFTGTLVLQLDGFRLLTGGGEIEVSIHQDEDGTLGHIRWILFRAHRSVSDFIGSDADDVVQALLQLGHLEKECRSGLRDQLPSSWELLKGKVHMWTREQSRAYAQSKMKYGSSPAGNQLPISPRWTSVSSQPFDVIRY